jgi:hypothetical protein
MITVQYSTVQYTCLVCTQSPCVPRAAASWSEDWRLGWNVAQERSRTHFFLWDSQLPKALWQYCVSIHCAIEIRLNWQGLLSAGWRYGSCLWHSWTTCLRTESFLHPSGLQDLRSYSVWLFSLGCHRKLGAFEQYPHNWWFEDGHHRVHSECWPCCTEHGLWEHSSACQ